jgi:hypothetical protein
MQYSDSEFDSQLEACKIRNSIIGRGMGDEKVSVSSAWFCETICILRLTWASESTLLELENMSPDERNKPCNLKKLNDCKRDASEAFLLIASFQIEDEIFN